MKSQLKLSAALRGVRLILFAALTALALMPSASQASPTLVTAAGVSHTPNGRTLIDHRLMHSGARKRAIGGTGSSVVPIPGAVQTFDVFNPPPAFRPLAGFQGSTLTNDPVNPPVYINTLTPTNLTPVWSADETFIVFSSNRTLLGGVQTDGRFHLWGISVSGGEAYQITSSTGLTGGGEFFPALSANNKKLAFTSDAQSSGVQNLYAIPFDYSILVSSNNSVTANITDTTAYSSLTMRGNDAFGFPTTGFDQVQRPTFSPSNDGLFVFSARSVTGTNKGHFHIYFLFQNTGGFDPNSISFPGKMTDGPADDTDPAWSKDSQFIAIASTANSFSNQANGSNTLGPTPPGGEQDPNQSQSLSAVSNNPNGLRSLFLLGGGIATNNGIGIGTIPASLQPVGGRITRAGTDNFGPAWSFITPNQYTNLAPGFEYLAFARGASPTSPHDIFYLQTVRAIDSGGESGRSNEAATTPEPINTPIYQLDADGGFASNTGNSYTIDTSFVTGGVSGTDGNPANIASYPANTLFNTANDPGTPPEIYQSYEGTKGNAFTYTFTNLTPGASYTVRLHFADPLSTAPGQRVFDVFTNGQESQAGYDIFQRAHVQPGLLSGLVSSASTPGQPLAGAAITVRDANGSTITPTPSPLTTSSQATSPSPPNGDNNPLNYTGRVSSQQQGPYTVTASALGYTSETQTVNITTSGFARADFVLTQNTTTGTLSGTVTSGGAKVSGATIMVTDPNTNAVIVTTPAFVSTNGNGNYGPATLPPGTYNVTETPQPGSGYDIQTQQVTITGGATTTTNFTLAAGAANGVLYGLVKDAVTGYALGGGTVQVLNNSGAVVAILNTSNAQFSTPAAPNGDGGVANYSGSIAAGTYTIRIFVPGYLSGGQTTSQVGGIPVPAAGSKRADPSPAFTSANANGQTPVVVLRLPGVQASTSDSGTNRAGTIQVTLRNDQTQNGDTPKNTPIIQGIEIRADGYVTTSSGFGAQTFTSAPSAPTKLTAIGGDHQVVLSFVPPSDQGNQNIAPNFYNIFRSPVTTNSTTSVNTPGTGAGTEGTTPYVTNATVTTDPNTGNPIFTDPNVTDGNEYFYQVTAVFLETITPETPAAGSNPIIHLNTDDKPNQTSVAGNAYDDIYPAWSPLLSIFSITYQSGAYNAATGVVTSGRTVTYNDPTTSFPSETAISVPAGGTVATTDPSNPSYSVGQNYTGIFESQVLNLDPPTLLRFSSDEIVHVQAGNNPNPITGTPTKLGVAPGQTVTFTVRLSDREAGINDNNNAPDAGLPIGDSDPARAQVYMQIKDPDSKYQDSQHLEHKVFAKDETFSKQSNRLSFETVNSGTANSLFDANFNVRYSGQTTRGARGGLYHDGSVVAIGKSGGGNNPNRLANGTFVPGEDPGLFVPWGPEYECQFVNPQFATSGNLNAPNDTTIGDYGSPYYLAGVDDQQPFSGTFSDPSTGNPLGRQRPTKNAPNNSGGNTPAEWLQMSPVPPSQQDHLGGVLYTVTWTTPISGSDYYLDVIAFDKARFPNFPAQTSSFSGGSVNWRIYDNVGGFSTQSSIGNNDILVVSDYALGQKFASSTFGGTNGNLNLVPKIFGTESYMTDVDINILPDRVYGGYPNGQLTPFDGPIRNGLGVGSYNDSVTDDGGQIDSRPFVNSQKYSIWRILSRGPVPETVLNSYLPTRQSQPAVADMQNPTAAYHAIPATTILDAHRCVIWLAPYTGDLLTDPGSLDDPGSFNRAGSPDRQSTQAILKNFVLGDGTSAHPGGGRLFMTGQDVASGLTLGGTVGAGPSDFLSSTLNAGYTITAPVGVNVLTATANRIMGNPQFNGNFTGSYPAQGVSYFFPYQDNLEIGDKQLSDGSLDQRPPFFNGNASLQGAFDVIAPTNNALTAASYASDNLSAMVFHDDPFIDPTTTGTKAKPGTPNGGTGSRVVFAAFGLEGLSSDTSAAIDNSGNTNPGATPPPVLPRNPRPNILHNIVDYLRTGTVTGLITQTAGTGQGAGQGVPNVTVYLVPTGSAPPPTRATFSATTNADGTFAITGVEPGTYTVAAYKAGYTRAVSNANVSFTVEGDTTATGAALTITPLPPGNIAGKIQDPAGNPIAGATATFSSQDKTIVKSITTFDGSNAAQPIGTYFLPNVPVTFYTGTASGPNNPNGLPEYQVAAAPDAPNNAGFSVLANTTTQPVNFTLIPILATVSGRVFDNTIGDTAAGGAPLANATVTLTNAAGTVIATTTTALADGTYTFANVPAATTATIYTITATKAGYSTTANSTTVSVFLGDAVTGKDIGLTPIQPGSISGTVIDNSGNHVNLATVTFTTGGTTGTTVTGTTNANGVYTIANVPSGTYTGTAIGPLNPHGRPTSTSSTSSPVTVQSNTPAGPVNFVVTPIPPSFSGIISGTNLANVTAALVGATITVTNVNTGVVVYTGTSGTNGVYSTGPLPPGTYTVTATHTGFAPGSLLGQDPDDRGTSINAFIGDALINQNINLTAIPPGSIFGTVKDKAGNPVPSSTVTFISTDGTVTLTATTDSTGTFMIPTLPPNNVPAGSYNGSAVGPARNGTQQYQPAPTQAITVVSGQGAGPVNFVVTPILPTVTGIVTDGTTSAPIPGATVTFTPASGAPLTFTTDGSGNYTTGGIPVGIYTVTASAANYVTKPVPLTLNLGDTATQPFALDEQATLVGLVTDAATNAILSGATITIKDSTGAIVATLPSPVTSTATTTTGADGKPFNYQAAIDLAGHPAGSTYTVIASRSTFNSQTVTIVLKQGFNRLDFTVTHALLSSIGTLGGLVTDSTDTTPVTGATVTVMDTNQNVVAQFTTSGSATAAPNGGLLNYIGTLTQGTYTAKVTKGSRVSAVKTITVIGGQFNPLDFTGTTSGLPPLYTIPAGLNFLSAPYDYSAIGFDGLFGTLNTSPTGTAANGNRSHVAVWDPTQGVYALDPNPPADTLHLGVGYWVYLKNPVNVTQQGNTPSAATAPVALHPVWNQIGVPNPKGVAVSSLLFDSGVGTMITFAQATSSQYHLIAPTLYRFDGANYQPVAPTDTLQPWQAYWIHAYADATLEIPTQ